MKLTSQQMQRIVEKVLNALKQNNVAHFKVDEKIVAARALKAIQDDYQKELDLEKDVNKMLEQLERTNAGQFERYKMYPLLKKQLAKEKKVIL